MFQPEKLTHSSQQTLQQTIALAQQQHHSEITGLHLASALLNHSGVSQELLAKLGDLALLQSSLNQKLTQLPTTTDHEPRISAQLSQILNTAASLAEKNQASYITQELLLQALIEHSTDFKSILTENNITHAQINEAIKAMKTQNPDSPNAETTYNVLEKYTVNLTAKAKQGSLDPVIGRDQEIRRVMQVLSRRTKNNPVLIGDPGVGKTAIVEGLAQRINSGDVPDSLKNKQLLVLDISSVLAGAKFRGEFEERLKAVLKALTSQPDHYVVFIDELHTIVGAGSAEGAVDASNMLKPGLARGELHVIGATTINEYRKYIEKDAALERRFQPVTVSEPSPEDSIAILRGLKEKYELHHGVGITDDALTAAVTLSSRYIADRFLPDKAIDLLDEASSAIKIETQSKPESIDILTRKITQLEIEKKALSSEKTDTAKQNLAGIDQQLANLKEEANTLETRWQTQKAQLDEINKVRETIDSLKLKLEEAERNVQLDEAAKIKYGQLPENQKKLEALEAKWNDIPSDQKLIKDRVSAEDIATVVSRWTQVPVTKLLDTEAAKLSQLEDELAAKVIGQTDAITAVANAIRRSRAGLAEEDKPIATFLFLGPTGVGKTETAKALAETMFDSTKALLRIDMSEYGERHSVARLIGAPPGYVGYEEGGQLTEAVRRHPYSVILLDEIEKAHSDIFNIFLQIFDDGRLTDGKGRTVDFRNCVIIMTSNLGSKIITDHSGKLEAIQDQIWEILKNKFPPEFINRIDQIIIYDNLTSEQVESIVRLQLNQLQSKLDSRQIKLDFDAKAMKHLAKLGFDPHYGARPLKRVIQQQILDHLALLITQGKLSDNSKLAISATSSGLTFKPVSD